MKKTIHIRFYEELNDFLKEKFRKKDIPFSFYGQNTIKDIIESIGIPHVEVDLILVSNQAVDFNYLPADQDRISVYPVFETLDIKTLNKLRPQPLRQTKFIADVHLGKLARYLRICGFDTYYEKNLEDLTIVEISITERRIVLTRDVNLLKHKKLTHGIWIRNQNSQKQLSEVIHRLQLESKIALLSRCSLCNGKLQKVRKEEVVKRLQPRTKQYYTEFFQCNNCKKVYWKGSHFSQMTSLIESIAGSAL